MENNEKRYYEDLNLLERMKYRREFNALQGQGTVWLTIILLALGMTLFGGVLFLYFSLSPNRQYWHFGGFTFFHAGIFILFPMMLTMSKGEKNLLKALGSKNQILLFFTALALAAVGNTLIIISAATKMSEVWLYYAAMFIPGLGTTLLLIPFIFPNKKIQESAKKDEESFFTWLEKEKNIVKKPQNLPPQD